MRPRRSSVSGWAGRGGWFDPWGLALGLLVVVGLAGVTACGSDEPRAQRGHEVVLVTYESFALPERAAAEFTRRTGTRIRVIRSGDAAEMLTKALLGAGAPEGDVIFGIDNMLAAKALAADLLAEDTHAGEDSAAGDFAVPGAKGRLVPIDHGEVCLNLDPTWFEQHGVEAPTSLADLVDARYKGLTVISSPVTSSPGLALLVGTVAEFGEDGWRDYWQRLKANDVLVRPSWSDAYYGDYTVSGGKRPIVLSYASSPPAEVVFSEGKRTQPVSQVLTGTCVAQIEYAGVLRGTKHAATAQELLQFMQSPEWQRELPLTNFVYPVADVELPEEFRRWAPPVADPLSLSPTVIDAGRERWIEAWREIME